MANILNILTSSNGHSVLWDLYFHRKLPFSQMQMIAFNIENLIGLQIYKYGMDLMKTLATCVVGKMPTLTSGFSRDNEIVNS